MTAPLQSINGAAEIIETVQARADLDQVLGIRAFSLDRILEEEPDFLLPLDAAQPDAEHTHSSDVTSVGIEAEGNLDFSKAQRWLSTLLRVRAAAWSCHPACKLNNSTSTVPHQAGYRLDVMTLHSLPQRALAAGDCCVNPGRCAGMFSRACTC